MGTILTGLCALSTCHPEQNPAYAGQHIYKSREVQDKQIVRLIGKIPTLAALAYHRASGRKPAPPNQKLGYAEVRARGGAAGGAAELGRGAKAASAWDPGGCRPATPCLPACLPRSTHLTAPLHPLRLTSINHAMQNFLCMLDP